MGSISKTIFKGWRNEVRFVVGTPEDLAADRGEEALTLVDAQLRYGLSRRALREAIKTRRLIAVGMVGNAALYRSSDVAAIGGETPDTDRHPAWAALSAKLLKHAVCAACGRTRDLHVHHIVPVSVDRSLELVELNTIVLCADDHLFVGHGGKWRKYNPDVIADAAALMADPTSRSTIEQAITTKTVAASGMPGSPETANYDNLAVTAVVGSHDKLTRGEGVTAVSAAEAALWLRVTKARIFQIIHEWDITPIAAYANIQFFNAEELRKALVGPREPEVRDTRFSVTFTPPPAWAIRRGPSPRRPKRKPRRVAID